MTRKQFNALALAVRQGAVQAVSPDARLVHYNTARYVADVCAAYNPRFDRPKFLAACGVVEPWSVAN